MTNEPLVDIDHFDPGESRIEAVQHPLPQKWPRELPCLIRFRGQLAFTHVLEMEPPWAYSVFIE